ncbi:MAG: TIGR03560 family F420-dependent LLM class oxidoreductase [Chloroflexota bacterium]|nr:TIGR03560 family F420-dependent LLM class oxidoreductase [Chloroflexota bacterium]
MKIGLMIEGQDGLNWPRWQRLARAAEELGFHGLYRSDHLTNPQGPNLDALEMFSSQTWLASQTSRIEFGPIVSPVSFRDPIVTAWTAMAISDLSGGRFRLGLGAGWQEREHREFGYELGSLKHRFDRFEEALQVITLLLRSEEPVSFEGEFYRMENALLLPRPQATGQPPITIGGKGPKRTLPLTARYADEWNGVGITVDHFKSLNGLLDDLLREEGRPVEAVRRTLMTRVVLGRDQDEVDARRGEASVADLRERGAIIGTPPEVREQLRELAAAGVEVVMLQWLDGLDDLAGIEFLAQATIHAG